MTEKTDQQTTDIQFQVQKLYTKDISLEITPAEFEALQI